jgi:xanthine dehydrogenase accessory factor
MSEVAWLGRALEILQRQSVARVLVAVVHGSAPREAGTCMLVMADRTEGTIGGGQLEWQAIESARELLRGGECQGRLMRLVLATDLGQCCGGVVEVWIERLSHRDGGWIAGAIEAGRQGVAVLRSAIRSGQIARKISSKQSDDFAVSELLSAPAKSASPRVSRDPDITVLERLDDMLPAVWLYGAGHVGQALAHITRGLPLNLTWIDGREGVFTSCPEGIQVRNDPDPVSTVALAPSNAFFLVMTHSHPLDFDLCHAILDRADFAWLGLIGSKSKAARFRSRLTHEGLTAEVLTRLVSPIGVSGIKSKYPAAIAVAVAAQLLQMIDGQVGPHVPPVATDTVSAMSPNDCGRSCRQCGKKSDDEKATLN